MKMKQFKKIVSIIMALAMVLAMGITSFADGSTAAHTITITNSKSGHTYRAYQVFKGNVSEDNILTNVEWGSGVDGDAILADLQSLDAYSTCKSAQDVTEVLTGFSNNSDEIDAFAEVVGKHLSKTYEVSSQSEKVDSKGNYSYTIDVTGDGYYLVMDDEGTPLASSDAYTKYILQVVNNVEVEAKADAPTIDKVIVEDNTDKEYNNVAIGDTVNYKVTSNVPKMDGYNKYYFIVNDTLSIGLDFNDDVSITVGEEVLSDDAYTVTSEKVDGTGETTVKIVFNDFLNKYKDLAGADIVITYSAVLNENAVIGSTGNPNNVDLTYSTNPNYDYKGDNEPLENEPTGTTPKSFTVTYVTEIDITKVDAANDNLKLAGATFKIEGENLLNTVLVTGQEYVADDNGTYYKLNDGTYTETVPAGDAASKYESTTQKYVLNEVVKKVITKADNVTYEATSGEDGVLKLTGLKAGTYTITETQAPAGYNLLTEPIVVKISYKDPEVKIPTTGDEQSIWEVAASYSIVGGEAIEATVDADGHITFSVDNNKGTTLPSTGGTGVKVLYTVGAILVLGAAVLLITRRRMKLMD